MGAMQETDLEASVLVVDDDPTLARYLSRSLEHMGFPTIVATSGFQGLDALARNHVGVVISDQAMPGMDGLAFLNEARRMKPEVVRIMLTAHGGFQHAREAINQAHIFGYLTKPCSLDELRRTVSEAFSHFRQEMENRALRDQWNRSNRRYERLISELRGTIEAKNQEIEGMFREGVMTVALIAEAKDDVTGNHVRRMAQLVRRLSESLAIEPSRTDLIAYSSMLHDVGKIHIPDAILKKPGRLTPKEWRIMKSHTVTGAHILSARRFETARRIARSHHERWDGTGYPDGIQGEAIPLEARIVAVADVFDALTHDRPYKRAWPVERALEELSSQIEGAFDPEIARTFINLVESGRLPHLEETGDLEPVDGDTRDPGTPREG